MKGVAIKFVFFFLVVVILLVVAIAVINPSPAEPTNTQTKVTDPVRFATYEEMLELGDDAIYVENQQSGQKSVRIGFVMLSKPGFVVVYNDDGGVPGAIIGKSELLKSGGEHFVVILDIPLTQDQVYYAMLYFDDGDERFRASEDSQVVDSEQSVVLMSFLAGL